MYRYKAFFSYKRHPLTDEWHRRVMERIQFWLSQELAAPDASIFFDSRSIDNGVLFNQAIATALKNSAVIISMMSPLYFTSPYCLAEIETFMQREDHLRRDRGALISCARFHDGTAYPMPFAHMEAEDFSPFANPAKGFWDSPDAVIFEARIRDFAIAVADKIKAAPEWAPDFPEPRYDPASGIPPRPIKRPANYLEPAVP